MLYWHRDFSTVTTGSFEHGDIAWFPEGALNASYNCVDRWAYKDPNKVGAEIYAIIRFGYEQHGRRRWFI